MNKRVKKLWLDGLRSGKFPQGQGALCAKGCYCCLGVLEYLASQEGVVSDPRGTDRNYLSDEVVTWAGLSTNNQGDSLGFGWNPYLGDKPAASLNDAGVTFTEIADHIEKYL